jgi:hypothetical protein
MILQMCFSLAACKINCLVCICRHVYSSNIFFQALNAMVLVLPTPDVDQVNGMKVLQRLFIAQFDHEENVSIPAIR